MNGIEGSYEAEHLGGGFEVKMSVGGSVAERTLGGGEVQA